MEQCYVLYLFRAATGFSLGISVPWIAGPVELLTYDDEASLRLTLRRFLNEQQQDEMVKASTTNQMYVLSNVLIDDFTARGLGVQLHDGDMPMETNRIVFSRRSKDGTELVVTVVLNNQIMPPPHSGCFSWAQVVKALAVPEFPPLFQPGQIEAIREEIEQKGSAIRDFHGNARGVVAQLSEPVPSEN